MFKIKNRSSGIVAVLSFLLMGSFPLFSQEKTIINPYIQLQYFKNTDNERTLQATLTYSENRMELPLTGMEISFYSGSAVKVLLATVNTDEKGIAKFPIDENVKLSLVKNEWIFSSEFKGNDTIEACLSEITVRDMKLEMILSEVDTIHTIVLKAVTSENGKETPVSGEIVIISVPRMFSLLPVIEATLDDNGTAVVEFPSDIPGDKEGFLTIIARVDEHPSYGNVERKAVQKWGIPTEYAIPKIHRALWTKTPPMWMIITLSILLTGVWGHYLFAIISLIRIKRESKKQKKL
jgi:hypothetical protein